MVKQIRLRRIAGGVIKCDPRDVLIKRPQCPRVAVAADVLIGEDVGLSRYIVTIDTGAKQGRGPHYLNRR